MNEKMKVMFLLAVLALAPFASAGITLHNESIATQYSIGDLIRGTIKISFSDINSNALFRTNFENSMRLKDFLDLNGLASGGDYNCSIASCASGYSRNAQIDNLDLNTNKIVGLSLQGGGISNIGDASIKIEGNSAASCYNNLKVKVLDRVIANERYLTETCFNTKYGCFEQNLEYQQATIPTNNMYCNKITMPAGPAYKLGANVSVISLSGIVKMKLLRTDGAPLGECNLNVTSNGVFECIVPYSSHNESDYFVCVQASSSNYKIRFETHESCGTNNLGQSYGADYEVFAKNLKFDSPRIVINETSFSKSTGQSLKEKIRVYVNDNYGNNCAPYCVIPFEISGASQNLVFSDSYIKFDSNAAQGVLSTGVYELDSENSSISTNGPVVLDISKANFTIPDSASGNKLDIFFDNERIIRKTVNLSAGTFLFNINPGFAPYGREILFNILSSYNITSSRWNFGDGSSLITVNGRGARHRYLSEGTFSVEVSATRSDGIVSVRRFNVQSGNAKESANQTLREYEGYLKNVSASIDSFPSWTRESLRLGMGFDDLNRSIKELSLRFLTADNESDYEEIMNAIIGLRVPMKIRVDKQGTVPIGFGFENADVSILEGISDEDVDNERLYNQVLLWMEDNFESSVRFEQINAYYYSGEIEGVLTSFSFNTRSKKEISEDVYFIINYPKDQVIFSQDLSAQSLDSGTYWTVDSGESVFEFAIADLVQPGELGAYISPSVQDLGDFSSSEDVCNYDKKCDKDFGETGSNCSDCKPWGTLIFLLVLIVIFAGAAGLFLWWWYKNKYERSLFRTYQDLQNLMMFIANSKKSMNDRQIAEKLKKVGWSKEQIGYAFKKFDKENKKTNIRK